MKAVCFLIIFLISSLLVANGFTDDVSRVRKEKLGIKTAQEKPKPKVKQDRTMEDIGDALKKLNNKVNEISVDVKIIKDKIK